LAQKGPAVDVLLQERASNVLDLLSRARKVLGGDEHQSPPTAFVNRVDLEDDVGRGRF
jgi:hypothetical protein